MKKEEIIKLGELQKEIDAIERSLNQVIRSQSWTGNGSNKFACYMPNTIDSVNITEVPALKDKLYILLNTEYSTYLKELQGQRDRLILCQGESSYKPVDIL